MPEKLYPHPFSRQYWREAAAMLRETRVLAFAGIMIALRLIMKNLSIPIGPNLRINTSFFFNAYGSMIMGPVAAMLSAAVTDTLGYLIAPNGPYFFPFILTEMAGSLVFALCLWRTKITLRRVTLSRFLIDFGVNIVLQTPIMALYYQMMLGRHYTLFNVARIVKNVALFPLESVLLALFLRAMIPVTRRVGWDVPPMDELRPTRGNVIFLTAVSLLGIALVAGYTLFPAKK